MVSPKHPMVTGQHKGIQCIRVNIGIIILDVLIEHLTEKVVDFSSIKAGAVQIVVGALQVLQQISQRHRLPFTCGFVEHDVERLFVLRLFDMNNHALQLGRTLGSKHLVTLVTTHDIAGDLIPYDRVNITKVRQAALYLLVSSIARLQVFAGIVLGRLHLRYRNRADVHAGVDFRHRYLPSSE